MQVYLLDSDGKRVQKLVHRLVAEAFIPNINNLKQVNHKDENKLHNYANNLEWCDCKHNANHGKRNEKIRKGGYPVCEYGLDGKLIRIWKSSTHISEIYNVSPRTIYDSLIGISKYCRNRIFKKYSETKGKPIAPFDISKLPLNTRRLIEINKFEDIEVSECYIYNPKVIKDRIIYILNYFNQRINDELMTNQEIVSLENLYHNTVNINY